MRVSVAATVFNEEGSIRLLMDSLLAQTRQPDEVVICDGGSSDRTDSILREYCGRIDGLKILSAPGANISQGRNLAIAQSTGRIVATTDAGVRLHPNWLERLVAPFENYSGPEDSMAQAVAGFFVPDVSGPFQVALGATVLPHVSEISPGSFLPSSRSLAFTRELWQRVGGYPEWLDYCEDLVFDLRIKEEERVAFTWAPQALVFFRPRSSLGSFWQQYFRYARGDGKADLWRKRHAIRYATYLLLVPALLGHAIWGQDARWLGWLGLFAGGIVNCARPWRRLLYMSGESHVVNFLQSAAFVPVIRLVGDVAKMAGYPVGLVWRRQNRHRVEVHWRDV